MLQVAKGALPKLATPLELTGKSRDRSEGMHPEFTLVSPLLYPRTQPEGEEKWGPEDTDAIEARDSISTARCFTDRWAIYTGVRGSRKDRVGHPRARHTRPLAPGGRGRAGAPSGSKVVGCCNPEGQGLWRWSGPWFTQLN